MTKCVETLLNHLADPNITGPVGDEGLKGNALHAFMNVVLLVGFDRKMLMVADKFIQSGADVNEAPSDRYPINVLISTKAFEKISKRYESEFNENIKELVTMMLDRMQFPSVVQASKVEFDGKPVHDLQKKIFKYLKDEINKRAGKVWSLKQLCKAEILQSYGRKTEFVLKLHIPTPLKSFISGSNMKMWACQNFS